MKSIGHDRFRKIPEINEDCKFLWGGSSEDLESQFCEKQSWSFELTDWYDYMHFLFNWKFIRGILISRNSTEESMSQDLEQGLQLVLQSEKRHRPALAKFQSGPTMIDTMKSLQFVSSQFPSSLHLSCHLIPSKILWSNSSPCLMEKEIEAKIGIFI